MAQYFTRQRKILLDFLKSNTDIPLTAGDIALALRDEGISLSAVYRNLAILEKSGEIKKVATGEEKKTVYRFLNKHGECKNAIHLSCKKCGKMFHLESSVSAELIKNLNDSQNFSVDKSETVLYGICGKCK